MSEFSLNILIVEDDISIGLEIEIMLKEIGYKVIDLVDSSGKAARIIEKENPDLILMDVNIKGNLSGIELADNIAHLKIPIIFITGYNLDKNFELASKVENIGFLVKPIQKYTLQSTIEQAFKRMGERKGNEFVFPVRNTMIFKKRGVLFRIKVADINFVKASDDYTITNTTEGEFVSTIRLFEMEEELLPLGFVKSHRSFIINPDKILSFDTNNNEVMIEGIKIPVSRNNKSQIIEILKNRNE